jgi:hypothetical protein
VDNPSFCWGFASGVLVAGVLGFVLQRIRLASARSRADRNRQAVAGQTGQTPREVVRQARRARIEIFVWIIGILAIAACILFFLAQSQ